MTKIECAILSFLLIFASVDAKGLKGHATTAKHRRTKKASKGSSKSSNDQVNYQVQYYPEAPLCALVTDANKAYKYTLLAEDYMIHVNEITTSQLDPFTYYRTNVVPRQDTDMEISIHAGALDFDVQGTEAIEEFFVQLHTRDLAYHVWTMPRVCRVAGTNQNAPTTKVYLREYGLVQDSGEAASSLLNVFTTIELIFDDQGMATKLVSTRRNTLEDGKLV